MDRPTIRPACRRLAPGLVALAMLGGCRGRPPDVSAPAGADGPPELLSAYGLFRGDPAAQEPAAGVIPYDVNTPLFSDDAAKLRFVRLPPGGAAAYAPSDPFEFPTGTVLVKTFAYPHDFRDPAGGRRLVETRLLVREPGGWEGRTYVWNDAQTEAVLCLPGSDRPVRWTDARGRHRELTYAVPNANQCLGCHESRKVMRPIGTTARNLNRAPAGAGGGENQLDHWARAGLLTGAPPSGAAPRLPVWDDPATGGLEERARAWLDSNCAHCHNPDGPARASGLDLSFDQQDPLKRGFWKPPVAAGRGSGGRAFGIVPGRPDESILVHRVESRELGVMMPELGRRLVDENGAALVRAWVASLAPARP